MLKAISFFNLIFAVVYFLVYLQNGNRWIVLGLLTVVVFNWIVIRSLETGQLKWTALHWAFVLPDVSFGVFTGYNHILLLTDVIAYHYYPWNTVRLITSGLVFATAILLQVFLSWFEFKLKKTD
jgi:hypothetical protein